MEDGTLLSEHVRLSLFRIYQTALTNVIRHAQAKNISVDFSFDEDYVVLEIQDDGKGFAVPKRLRTLARQGHFGLAGAVERAEAIGGKLEVESEPGKGTRLRVIALVRKETENNH
jgi:signal transduction histidine kinase